MFDDWIEPSDKRHRTATCSPGGEHAWEGDLNFSTTGQKFDRTPIDGADKPTGQR